MRTVNWKFTDATLNVAFRTDANGDMESVVASTLPQGTLIDNPDAPPFAWPVLSPKQIRQQLFLDGNLSKVQPIIDSLTDPQKTMAQLAWDHASEFLHDDALMVQLAPAVGYDTEAKVRAFFTNAALL